MVALGGTLVDQLTFFGEQASALEEAISQQSGAILLWAMATPSTA